jgi:predicted XRE-type DNA-binding protein
VWDVLEDDPIKAQNLKLRSALMIAISQQIQKGQLNQTEAASRLGISQPRVSALMQGKLEAFRLDALVNFAHRLGLQVSMNIAV